MKTTKVEMHYLKKNKHYEPVKLLEGKKVLKSKWVFKFKNNGEK